MAWGSTTPPSPKTSSATLAPRYSDLVASPFTATPQRPPRSGRDAPHASFGRTVPPRRPPTTVDGPPGPSPDGPRVVPQPPVHVAEVVYRHPDRIEPGVTIGAEGEVLSERSVGVQRDAGSSLDAPEGGARLGARHWVADRIAEPEVAAEPVRSGLIEGVRDERQVFLEAAEVILSSAKRRGPSTVIVGPCVEQDTGEDAVASGGFALG